MASPVRLNPVSRRYSCDGGDVSLPLSWSAVPRDTVEVDLFIFKFLPVHEELVPVWGLAGLRPATRGLSAGHTPRKAVVGRNSFGHMSYSLCPPKGSMVQYEVLLYALPDKISAKPGFNVEALTNAAQKTAKSEGSLLFSYKRQ